MLSFGKKQPVVFQLSKHPKEGGGDKNKQAKKPKMTTIATATATTTSTTKTICQNKGDRKTLASLTKILGKYQLALGLVMVKLPIIRGTQMNFKGSLPFGSHFLPSANNNDMYSLRLSC